MGDPSLSLGGPPLSGLTLVGLRWFAIALFVACSTGVGLYLLRRRRVAQAIGDRDLIRDLIGSDISIPPKFRVGLVLLAASALALALLDPALTESRDRTEGAVVLLLDASGSMLADDGGVPRIDSQRAAARALVDQLPDVSVGIVAYAGRAFSLTPPTRDRGAIEMYLAALDPSIVTQSGSALDAAIRQGINLLTVEGEAPTGTLILMGDGDDTDDPDGGISAATLARGAGLIVHTLGFGTDAGAYVPALDISSGATSGYLTSSDGEMIVSRRAVDLLRQVSRGGGGIYADGEDDEAVLRLASTIRGTPTADSAPTRFLPRFSWLALVCLVLLVVEPWAATRRAP